MGDVLVTGAAGFIGTHLVEALLRAGSSVVGVDNFDDFYDPRLKRQNLAELPRGSPFLLEEADVTDHGAIRECFLRHEPRVVFHLAALAGVRPSVYAPERYTRVNVEGTACVLHAAVEAGVRTFVLASSSSVYGQSARPPFRENDCADRPESPYAASKRAAELLCHSFHATSGICMVCARLFSVYGPRQRPDLVISRYMRALLEGTELPVFGDGSSKRDYTYVGDVVDGLVRCGKLREGFHIFNLGNSEPVELMRLVELLEKVTGLKARVRFEPQRKGDVPITWADTSLAKAVLGWEARTPLLEGIEAQWKHMRERLA